MIEILVKKNCALFLNRCVCVCVWQGRQDVTEFDFSLGRFDILSRKCLAHVNMFGECGVLR